MRFLLATGYGAVFIAGIQMLFLDATEVTFLVVVRFLTTVLVTVFFLAFDEAEFDGKGSETNNRKRSETITSERDSINASLIETEVATADHLVRRFS